MVRRWWWLAVAASVMAGCRPEPKQAPAPPAPMPAAAKHDERAAGAATELAGLGVKVTLASGWHAREGAAAPALLPVGPPAALFDKPDATQAPLFLVATVAPEFLAKVDPRRYPAACVTQIGKDLAATQPGLKFPSAGELTAPPAPFVVAAELRAEGPFAELGLTQAKARLICGLCADNRILLVGGFAPDEAAGAEIDAMIKSVEVSSAANTAPAKAEPAKAEAPKGK
jgi:hypothetical protein